MRSIQSTVTVYVELVLTPQLSAISLLSNYFVFANNFAKATKVRRSKSMQLMNVDVVLDHSISCFALRCGYNITTFKRDCCTFSLAGCLNIACLIKLPPSTSHSIHCLLNDPPHGGQSEVIPFSHKEHRRLATIGGSARQADRQQSQRKDTTINIQF